MITKKKEVYYIPAFSYAFGRTISSGFKQAQQTNYPAFGHTTSGSVSMCGLVVGNYLGGIATTVNTSYPYLIPTGGIKLDGDTSDPVPIIGDKAYQRSMKLNMRITALKSEALSNDDKTVRPLSFRVLAFKIRGNRPANIVPNLRTGSTTNPSLFLDNINNDVGIDDTVVPYEIDNLRVNTENIEVVRDIKFELDQPVAAHTSGSFNHEYYTGHRNQTVKDLSIWLPCPKTPVKYDTAKTPTNWDYRKGNDEQNRTYCSKENVLYEHGQCSKQGKRFDIDTVKEVLTETGRMKDVVAQATSYQSIRMAEVWLKYFEKPVFRKYK